MTINEFEELRNAVNGLDNITADEAFRIMDEISDCKNEHEGAYTNGME